VALEVFLFVPLPVRRPAPAVPVLVPEPMTGSSPGSLIPPAHAQNPVPVPVVGKVTPNDAVPRPVPVPIQPCTKIHPPSQGSGHPSTPVPVALTVPDFVSLLGGGAASTPVLVLVPVLVFISPFLNCAAAGTPAPVLVPTPALASPGSSGGEAARPVLVLTLVPVPVSLAFAAEAPQAETVAPSDKRIIPPSDRGSIQLAIFIREACPCEPPDGKRPAVRSARRGLLRHRQWAPARLSATVASSSNLRANGLRPALTRSSATERAELAAFMKQREEAAAATFAGMCPRSTPSSLAGDGAAAFFHPRGPFVVSAAEVRAQYEHDAASFESGGTTHFEVLPLRDASVTFHSSRSSPG
jgi:hypothetical protein